jgi:hypothetical protein
MNNIEETHSILANENFRYCVCFLKNSGEKIRAMRLVRDVTGLPIGAVMSWVNALHIPLGVADELVRWVENPEYENATAEIVLTGVPQGLRESCKMPTNGRVNEFFVCSFCQELPEWTEP